MLSRRPFHIPEDGVPQRYSKKIIGIRSLKFNEEYDQFALEPNPNILKL